MSNIIDKIQLSGVTYDLPSGGSGNPTVELTQAEYDALVSGGTVDPDTYYIITDATPQDMSQYWTSAQTNSAITQAVSGKQDTLSAGTNITISGNVISASGGGGITSGEVQTMIDESISGKADTSYVQASRLKSMSGGSLDLSDHPSYIKNIDVKGNILKATWSYQDNGDYWGIYDKDVLRFGEGLLYKNHALSADERIIDSYSTENSYCYELSAVTTESYVNLKLSELFGVKFDGVQNFFMADFTLYGDSAQTNEKISISYRMNDGYMEGDLNIAVFNPNGKLVYTKTSTVYSQATTNIIIPFDFENLGFTTPSWLYVDSMVKDSITSICGVDRIKYTSVKEFVKELDSEIDTKVETSAITSAVTSASTDSEIPSAKAVYDALQEGGGGGGGTSYTAGTGIDITNDVISVTGKVDTSTYNTYTAATDTALASKQDTLVSGTNIKTINNESILGSGNITIEGGGGKAVSAGTNISITTGETADTINCTLPITATTDTTNKGIIIGQGITASNTSNGCVIIGSNAKGSSFDVIIGRQAKSDGGWTDVVAIGTEAKGYSESIAIGSYTETYRGYQEGGVAIGYYARAKNMANAVAIGHEVSTTGTTKTNINNQLKIDASNQVYIYNKDNTEMICLQDQLGGGGGGMTEDDELLLSTALTDLNDRKIDASEVKAKYQMKGDYVTTNTLNTRLAEYETALDEQNVEEVTAYALNDLNNKFGGLSLVKITESEYAALTTKDENTLYIVVADPS